MQTDGYGPRNEGNIYERVLHSSRELLSWELYRQLEEHSIEPLLRIPHLIGMSAEWKLTTLEKRLALLVQASS